MMDTVRQLLAAKGSEIWSVEPDESVYAALERMERANVGALMVVDQGRLVGIISERDYARKVILRGRFSRDTLVREIMSTEIVHVRPEDSLEACMALMTQHRVRHLPVLDDGRLAGVVSIGDVVKAIVEEKEFVIEQLENYIVGRSA